MPKGAGVKKLKDGLVQLYQINPYVVVLLLLVFLYFTSLLLSALFGFGTGHFSVDEATYHLMVKAMSDGDFIFIGNGYREFPSPALNSALLISSESGLVVQYPPFFGLMALPFYLLLGYKGLFLLNFLCFWFSGYLTYRISLMYCQNSHVAVVSSLLLVLCSFYSDYAIAAWPHSMVCCLVLTSTFLFLKAEPFSPEPCKYVWLILSGAVVGVAVGIRYDAIFMLGVISVALMIHRPFYVRSIVSVLVGIVPLLLVLAMFNYGKFGDFSIFSYGRSGGNTDVSAYFPLLLAFTVFVLVASLVEIKYCLKYVPVLLIIYICAAFFIDEIRQASVKFFLGFFQLVIDLRARDISIVEPALVRGDGGEMLYFGALKKSLIQSMPWIVLVSVPFVKSWVRLRRGEPVSSEVLFLLIIVFYVIPYSYLAWHGGMSLNLRYFTPILPFVSILASKVIFDLFLLVRCERQGRVFTGIAAVLVFMCLLGYSLWGGVILRSAGSPPDSVVFLDTPIILAITLLLALMFVKQFASNCYTRNFLPVLLAVTISWSAGVTFGYDVPKSVAMRKQNDIIATVAERALPDNILLFVGYVDPFWSLIDDRDVIIANPFVDQFRSFRSMAEHFMSKGKRVFVILNRNQWGALQGAGVLSGFDVKYSKEVYGLVIGEVM